MALFQSEGSKHQDKLSEEYLYGSVADEIANNHVSPGLWAKAFSEADGDEKKAQARYIKARVALLKSEQSAVLEAIGNRKPVEISPKALPIETKPLTVQEIVPQAQATSIGIGGVIFAIGGIVMFGFFKTGSSLPLWVLGSGGACQDFCV